MLQVIGSYFAGYVVGCIFIAGTLQNGVRDEMDGIIDLVQIIFWPIVLPLKIVFKLGSLVYKLGAMLKGYI